MSNPCVASDFYRMAGLGHPTSVWSRPMRISQGVALAFAEHCLFTPEQANDFLIFEVLLRRPGGCGGNLAECYIHGFGLVV